MDKVGVILNQNDEIASFLDGVKVAIYEKIASEWTKLSEVKDCFNQKGSVNQMRDFLSKLVLEMKDCKILIGTMIIGIPYMILDREGFWLCEADEISDTLFTAAASDYDKIQDEMLNSVEVPLEDYPTAPYQTQQNGVYELNLRKLQEQHPEISSKKALIPFLKKTKFDRLDVYCSHVMPWLDYELTALGLTYSAVKSEEGYKVEVSTVL